ncbi:MAG: hypothetical protein ABSC88_09960 [Terracidiphilus sp.]|jgi:hypothetical protein
MLGFLGREFAPIALTLYLVHGQNLLLLAVSFVGFLSCYEIGYLDNDLAASSAEAGGARLAGAAPRYWAFVTSRIVYMAGAACWIGCRVGVHAMLVFVVSTIVVVSMAAFHTRAGLSGRTWLRIATFLSLAVYKYGPWTLPFVTFSYGAQILLGSFLFYGLSRAVAYSVRKLFAEQREFRGGLEQQPVQAVLIAVLCPIALFSGSKDILYLWAIHGAIVALSGTATWFRRFV